MSATFSTPIGGHVSKFVGVDGDSACGSARGRRVRRGSGRGRRRCRSSRTAWRRCRCRTVLEARDRWARWSRPREMPGLMALLGRFEKEHPHPGSAGRRGSRCRSPAPWDHPELGGFNRSTTWDHLAASHGTTRYPPAAVLLLVVVVLGGAPTSRSGRRRWRSGSSTRMRSEKSNASVCESRACARSSGSPRSTADRPPPRRGGRARSL
ncbi:MAG: hypothetical protein JWO62_3711 [Acidimicrobiaceae bacterium]|jgi:hypothetical protein|nr:hypothetical protein [Acidimicrobiaceae bacterium]